MTINSKNIIHVRMVRRGVIAWVLVAICLPCYAQQNLSAGLHAGMAATRVWNGHNSSASGYYFQGAPLAGLQVRHIITNQFSVAGELNYDVIKSKKEGLSALTPGTVPNLDAGSTYYAYVNNSILLKYISVAVLGRINIIGRSNLYVEGGPFIGKLLYSKLTVNGNSLIYKNSDATEVVKPDGVHALPAQVINTSYSMRGQLSLINAGASMGFGILLPKLKPGSSISTRYTFGIVNISHARHAEGIYKTDQLSIILTFGL